MTTSRLKRRWVLVGLLALPACGRYAMPELLPGIPEAPVPAAEPCPGCADPPPAEPVVSPSPLLPPEATVRPGTAQRVQSGAKPVNLVATSARSVAVHQAPDEHSPSRLLDPARETSRQLVFLVRDQRPDWLEVYLPVRPNGSTGWVRRGDVALSQHHYRIELSLSRHRLQLFHGANVVMDEPIGVGTGRTPTPGGVYYIKELLRPPDPAGSYGPYAYGLSGFSEELSTFAGGEGVIGLHGTDRPSSVGRDVSHGCIRLHNRAITRLVEEVGLPLGTPVVIDA